MFAFSWPPEAINTQVVLAEISRLSVPSWEGSVCVLRGVGRRKEDSNVLRHPDSG